MPRGYDTSGDDRRQPLKPGDAGYALPSIAGLLTNMANRQQPQITRNRWGDVIDPSKPKPTPKPKRDPGEYPTDEELEEMEPTFLEGPLGYRNWRDARINRYS